jgi:hypothetical protein
MRTEAEATASAEFTRLERAENRPVLWSANAPSHCEMTPVRVPSMMATRSPTEALAEIGSHLILDGRAPAYLPEPVVRLFDEPVLGNAR